MATAETAAPVSQETREFGEPARKERDQKMVTVAIYAVILLTVAAVAGLLLVMLWGARVRRQAREPLPPTSRNDRLWYLKAGKPRQREPDGPSHVSEKDTETDQNQDDSSSA